MTASLAPSARRPQLVREGAARSSEKLLARFLTFLAEETPVSAATARLYLRHLQRFAAWLDGTSRASLLDATTHDLRAYRAHLVEERGQKPASVNSALAALRRFYRWSTITAELLPRDPTRTLADVATQPLAPKGFTSVERHRLRREAERAGPVPDAIVTVLLQTALRVEELTGLRWEGLTLQARSGWAQIVGKGSKHRRVPLNAAARSALLAIRPAPAAGVVFRGKRGPYTARGIRHLLAEVGRRANVANVHPHRFRHDAGRRLVEAVDLPTAAAILGHGSLNTVRTYSQPDAAALERAAAALERA